MQKILKEGGKMAKYTTQLRTIVESGYDIGLNDYPIFDENYRGVLNQKIIDHYYFREIGLETPALFKHFLKVRMQEIMPYYNRLYEADLLPLDPYISYDLTEEYTRENDGSTKSTGTGTSATTANNIRTDTAEQEEDNLNVHSDTSAGNLAVNDLKTNVYASSADRAELKQTVDSTNNEKINQNVATTGANDTIIDSIEKYTNRKYGAIGVKTMSAMLVEFREAMIKLDQMVILELNDLFMGIY